MPKPKERRRLTAEEQAILEKLSRSGTVESRLVERAKMVLWSREGISGNQIAQRLGHKAETVYRQLDRFEAEGLSGLQDRAGRGRPPEYSETERGQIIAVARSHPQTLGCEFGYWSLDRLVEYVNLTLGTHLVHAHHLGLGRRLLVHRYDRPLFSANCGSGRSVKYVFSWYQRKPSARSTRYNCVRPMGIPSVRFTYSTRRSNDQYPNSQPSVWGWLRATAMICPRSVSLYSGGRPRPARSCSPLSPSASKRSSWRYTVSALWPSRCAIWLPLIPSRDHNTILARSTNRLSTVPDRLSFSNIACSSAVSSPTFFRFGHALLLLSILSDFLWNAAITERDLRRAPFCACGDKGGRPKVGRG